MPRNRQTALAAVLLLALAAAVAWMWFGPSSAAQAPASQPRAASRRSTSDEAPLPEAEAVRLDALASTREEPAEATRNPFRFDRRASAPAAGPTDPPPALTLKPVEPPVPSGPPPPPAITLKFIGIVETAAGIRLAVLSPGEGRAPMHGKEGDIIDGRYRILRIGTESIELAYLDGRGRQTIRLTGQ